MYALVAALCAWSSYFLLRWSARPAWKTAALSAALLAAATHCHYYAIFLLPGHLLVAAAVVVGAPRRRRVAVGRTWALATAVALLTVIAWLVYARGGFAYDDGFAFPLNTIDGQSWRNGTVFISRELRPRDWSKCVCERDGLGDLARRGTRPGPGSANT